MQVNLNLSPTHAINYIYIYANKLNNTWSLWKGKHVCIFAGWLRLTGGSYVNLSMTSISLLLVLLVILTGRSFLTCLFVECQFAATSIKWKTIEHCIVYIVYELFSMLINRPVPSWFHEIALVPVSVCMCICLSVCLSVYLSTPEGINNQ